MKVPATCPGEQNKEEKKKLKAERQEAATGLKSPTNSTPHDGVAELPTMSRTNTMNSLSSGYAASANRSVSGGPATPTGENPPDRPTSLKPQLSGSNTLRKSRVVAPPPTAYISELPGSSVNGSGSSSEQKGKMLYAYDANGDGEITVAEGKEVTILEADGKQFVFSKNYHLQSFIDGGWTKIKAGFKEGLVPTAYIEILATAPPRPSSIYSNSGSSMAGSVTTRKQGPAVAPRRGAKKLKYVEALYEYTAQSDAEHSMAEGERFVLIKEDPGDGWAEVEKGGVTKSVPANYVQAV